MEKTWIVVKKIGSDWCVVEQLFSPFKPAKHTVIAAFRESYEATKLQKQMLASRSKLEALERQMEEDKDW